MNEIRNLGEPFAQIAILEFALFAAMAIYLIVYFVKYLFKNFKN